MVHSIEVILKNIYTVQYTSIHCIMYIVQHPYFSTYKIHNVPLKNQICINIYTNPIVLCIREYQRSMIHSMNHGSNRLQNRHEKISRNLLIYPYPILAYQFYRVIIFIVVGLPSLLILFINNNNNRSYIIQRDFQIFL